MFVSNESLGTLQFDSLFHESLGTLQFDSLFQSESNCNVPNDSQSESNCNVPSDSLTPDESKKQRQPMFWLVAVYHLTSEKDLTAYLSLLFFLFLLSVSDHQ